MSTTTTPTERIEMDTDVTPFAAARDAMEAGANRLQICEAAAWAATVRLSKYMRPTSWANTYRTIFDNVCARTNNYLEDTLRDYADYAAWAAMDLAIAIGRVARDATGGETLRTCPTCGFRAIPRGEGNVWTCGTDDH